MQALLLEIWVTINRYKTFDEKGKIKGLEAEKKEIFSRQIEHTKID